LTRRVAAAAVQGYHVDCDEFSYNYGQVKAALGQYDDAIKVLLNRLLL